MKNSFAILLVLPILLAAAAPARGQSTEGQPAEGGARHPLRPVMQLKLDYSKDLLEGLALEDYAKIAKSSQNLGLLSLESGWKMLQTEEYIRHSMDFRRTANVISEAAREKNLERAALGYVALTVRCIECHGYLRKEHPELSVDREKRDSGQAEHPAAK
jgi:hypothetical protein